jgi:hypothetical protein
LSRKEKKRRSVWRELSFIVFMVKSNIVSLEHVASDFAEIRGIFLVEKRVKKRDMQLARRKLS